MSIPALATAPAPALLTFDIFGTVLDWRAGLTASLAKRGVTLGNRFDEVVDRQGALEQLPYETYAAITARSIADLGVGPDDAAAVGREVGTWPLFGDSTDALRRLMAIAPCAAMTNSDRAHGQEVQQTLGFALSHWICAEDVRIYKPNPAFWNAVRDRTQMPFGPAWWHVSAYADYDLDVAGKLGLTTVFIPRAHSRPGPASMTFPTLAALADHVHYAHS